ncbi:MAG: DUF2157 domain-containing protein [Gammaproteobacteria bacterium]|nr:DUF2157 domain-containing protein [Gammaproteobacteria bacterium]
MRLLRLLKRDLAQETLLWVEQGHISHQQARAICRNYGIDIDSIAQRALGYSVLTGLGYLFAGLAVITILSANWDDIPRWIRMAGLIALTGAAHGYGLRLHLAGRTASATGLFLFGNVLYGASIALIAQIYHLGEHMPNGILLWALGTMPFAVILLSDRLMSVSLAIAFIWFFVELDTGYFPALFPLFLAASIYVLWRGKGSAILFLATAGGIGLWLVAALSTHWSEEYNDKFFPEQVFISIALFLFAYAASHWFHQRESHKAKDYGILLSLWTLRFTLLSLFVLSFAEPWKMMIEAVYLHDKEMWIILMALTFGALWLGWLSGQAQKITTIAAGYLAIAIVVVYFDDSLYAIWLQILTNIVLLTTGIGLIWRGLQDGTSHYFFLGIVTLLLIGLIRYADLIGGYVGGALLFLLMAVLLLGAAKYWQRRQQMKAV